MIGGHRPDPGSDSGPGGPAAGGAIVDSHPDGPLDPTHDGGVLSSTGLPTTPGGHDSGSGDLFSALVRNIAAGVGPTVQPAAVAAVATTFGFPLALMLAVVLFLVIQSRLDGRDPKLRAAPLTTAETFLPFADEPGQ
jgi:hypothetical protein